MGRNARRRAEAAAVMTGRQPRQARRRPRISGGWYALGGAVVIVGGIAALVWASSQGGGAGTGSVQATTYAVADPRPGSKAPPLSLAATDGSTFDLSAWRGKTVLLYFQEGIGCEPCWTQLKDIQTHISQFQAEGISQVVTITGDQMPALRQKVGQEGITMPVLADPSLAVSTTYGGNTYGMMGNSADGHSFVLVGPDGIIQWRGDFGGPPNYTMYVPIPELLADIKKGMSGST